MTVLKLQQLAGILNHLCKACVPGKAFNSHFYPKFVGIKQHHHIRIDKEMKADATMWIKFLESFH